MLYYIHKERTPEYDKELEDKSSNIVKARTSYRTRRVTARICRSGMSAGRNEIRRDMRHMNLVMIGRKHVKKHIPGGPSYIKTKSDVGEGWIIMTAMVDLCSMKVKGYLISRMSRTSEMVEATCL